MLNSTITVLSKHQFGRAAGVEGNLKTEVVDVNMMLVPDIRKACPEAAARAVAACQRISKRDAKQFLYEEFALNDRRELDDATLEMLGIEDAGERVALRERLYRDVTDLQKSIRKRELIAQRDRRRSSKKGRISPQDVADELWSDHESSLNLLQFPEDFVRRPNEGEFFDLPSGDVEVGLAFIDTEGLLKPGTIRVGGRVGGSLGRGQRPEGPFLEGSVPLPSIRSGQARLPMMSVQMPSAAFSSTTTI